MGGEWTVELGGLLARGRRARREQGQRRSRGFLAVLSGSVELRRAQVGPGGGNVGRRRVQRRGAGVSSPRSSRSL